jgi:hypothetical protein
MCGLSCPVFFARLLLGGDRSAWDRALLMPHYTAAGMPLLSSRQVRPARACLSRITMTVVTQCAHVQCVAFVCTGSHTLHNLLSTHDLLCPVQVLHFIQLYLTGRCQLFDYGSEAANVAVYQQRTPPVVSDSYHMLRCGPVGCVRWLLPVHCGMLLHGCGVLPWGCHGQGCKQMCGVACCAAGMSLCTLLPGSTTASSLPATSAATTQPCGQQAWTSATERWGRAVRVGVLVDLLRLCQPSGLSCCL